MTGLDINSSALIEVAVIATNSNLKPLDDGIEVLIRPTDSALAEMPDVVREMHTKSGLLDALPGGLSMAEAEAVVLDYVKRWAPEAGKAPLAGNSVGTDKAFLDRDMPALIDHLNYRIIDVSSIKELAKRWYQKAYYAAPEKASGHRALADILESIKELQYYRGTIFVPEPGPTTEESKVIAERL